MNDPPTNLASEAHWNDAYAAHRFSAMPRDYPLVRKILEHVPPVTQGSVFEIGCFPGRFMPHFARLGYTVGGVDRTVHLGRMEDWLRGLGAKVGEFVRADVFELEPRPVHDLVFSSGFVEHFEQYVDVVRLHARFARPGGMIVVTAPNFAGAIQHLLHALLDARNLALHHLPAMNPGAWSRGLRAEGCDIVEAGYVGGFDFWVGDQPRSRLALRAVDAIVSRCPRRDAPNSRLYSPEIFVAARKRDR